MSKPAHSSRAETSPRKPSLLLVVVGALVVAGGAFGLWAHFRGHAHDGGHDHEHAAEAMSLNDGRRWETDAPLRTGMQRIREAVEPVLAARAAGRVTSADTARLAAAVDENVQYLFENCRLPPKADAALHGLITELLAGSATLKAEPISQAGSEQVAEALRRYPKYFEHPGWEPLTVPPAF